MLWKYRLRNILLKNIFIILVLAIAGNKFDKINEEVVNEEEARKFAEDNNAIFNLTSAKENIGINELFEMIEKKLLDPSITFDEQKNKCTKLGDKEENKEEDKIEYKDEIKNEDINEGKISGNNEKMKHKIKYNEEKNNENDKNSLKKIIGAKERSTSYKLHEFYNKEEEEKKKKKKRFLYF